jgi:hypothetical protein
MLRGTTKKTVVTKNLQMENESIYFQREKIKTPFLNSMPISCKPGYFIAGSPKS